MLDSLVELEEYYLNRNIRIRGIVLGVDDYFALKSLRPVGVEVMNLNGNEIYMDPLRTGGEPVALFFESEAMKVLNEVVSK